MPAGIEQSWIVGTAEDCDVRVLDEYASARHCVVTRHRGGIYLISDLGSTNGTWIRRADGTRVRVKEPTQVLPGDTLTIGRSVIHWAADQAA